MDEGRAAAAEQRLGEGRVVGTVAVQQMDRRAVGITTSQRPDPLEAAPRPDSEYVAPDLPQHDLQGRIVTAGQAEHPPGLQEPGGGQDPIGCDPSAAAVGEDDDSVLSQTAIGPVDRRSRRASTACVLPNRPQLRTRPQLASADPPGDVDAHVEVLGHDQ
jgi:hypothetical protein